MKPLLFIAIAVSGLLVGCNREVPIAKKPIYTPPKSRYSHEYDGPMLGEIAPAFTLTSLDQKTTTHLAEFRGKRPVVLIFGSYS